MDAGVRGKKTGMQEEKHRCFVHCLVLINNLGITSEG